METKRREVTYEQVLEKAFFIEDVVNNLDNRELKLRSNLIQPREGALGEFIDKLAFAWYTRLRPKLFTLLALFSVVLSLQLVVGELIILFNFEFSLLDLIPNTPYSQVFVNILTVALLLYEALCIYYGLFTLKFTSYYELHPNQ